MFVNAVRPRRLVTRASVVLAILFALAVAPSAAAQRPCTPTDFELAVDLTVAGTVDVGSTVRIGAGDARLVRELANCSIHSIPVPSFDWQLVTRPGSSQAVLGVNGLEASLTPDLPGRYVVRFVACPSTCTVRIGSRSVVVPAQWTDRIVEPGSADLWVMGMEINQGVQDQIHRGPAPVWIERGSSARPLVTGKPAIVRVYVGQRQRIGYPAREVAATGRLTVWVGESGVTLEPLAQGTTAHCLRRIGGQARVAADPCAATIGVRPTLGRAGLDRGETTPTPYDADLVTRRATWDGTLNFLVPANLLVGAREVMLRAEVWPVGLADPNRADNLFSLLHGKIARGPYGTVRLVLISFKDPETGTHIPAPTGPRDALRHILRRPSTEIVSPP